MTVENPPITVLIVEDDSISRSALAWLLQRTWDFNPLPWEIWRRHGKCWPKMTPQIMILDLMLPDGNGIELLAEIRNTRRSITVAVVSGVTDQLKLHELTALKPDAIFGKPVDVDDFDDWLVKQLSSFALTDFPRATEETRIDAPDAF